MSRKQKSKKKSVLRFGTSKKPAVNRPSASGVRAPTYRWGGSTTKTRNVTRSPAGCFERGRVLIAEVLIQSQHDTINQGLVRLIEESFEFMGGGCVQPIGIRRVVNHVDGWDVDQNVLVFGAARLQAQKNAGLKYIDCIYLSGSDTDIEIIQVGENLLRRIYTVLEEAEQTVKYYDLVGKKLAISGRLDQKCKRLGRRPGGLAQVARWLNALGGTDEARRLRLRKATAIAGIGESAKGIARETGLDNNQRVLLYISEAEDAGAQAERARGIADGTIRVPTASDIKSAKAMAEKKKQLATTKTAESTETEDDQEGPSRAAGGSADEADGIEEDDEASENEDDGGDEDETHDESSIVDNWNKNTLEEDLDAFWEPEGKRLWAFTPKDTRARFIKKLQRAKCRAMVDIDDFIEKTFRGRRNIGCETLEAFALSRGISWSGATKRLTELNYKRKKQDGHNGSWLYVNIDPDYKDRMRFVTDIELAGPVTEKREEDAKFVEEMELPSSDTDYLDDTGTDARRSKQALINDL